MSTLSSDAAFMRIRYRKAALADLEAIRSFIRKSNPHAAQRVIAEIREHVTGLAHFAASCRAGPVEGTGELVVVRYGYIVTYRIEADVVVILAVFHAAQDRPRGG
jgi:addiction module RelE/StbE family toxin